METPENGCLEYFLLSFWGVWAYFQVLLLLVSVSVPIWGASKLMQMYGKFEGCPWISIFFVHCLGWCHIMTPVNKKLILPEWPFRSIFSMEFSLQNGWVDPFCWQKSGFLFGFFGIIYRSMNSLNSSLPDLSKYVYLHVMFEYLTYFQWTNVGRIPSIQKTRFSWIPDQ